MWPFNRRRSDAPREESAPAPYAPGRAEWRQLPPLQRVVGDQWLVNPPDSLSSRLASWQDPTYLAPLGHAVIPQGPSGAIEPAPAPAPAVPTEPRRIDLQRKAGPARSDALTPTHSLQQNASDSVRPAALGMKSEPEALQRSVDTEAPFPDSGPALTAGIEDRPLVGDDSGLPPVDAPEPSAAQRDSDSPIELPMRSESLASSLSLGSSPSLQRSPQPDSRSDQPLEVATGLAVSLPVQPVSLPFAMQRMLIGDHTASANPAVPSPTSVASSNLPSLLASTDPPERRELPVVARLSTAVGSPAPALTPAVQRATEPTLPLLGDTGLATSVASESPAGDVGPQLGESGLSAEMPLAAPALEPETAPLLGTVGLAAPIVQTSREEVPPAEPQAPMPIAPLVADQPRPGPTSARHVQRLGLGSPLSGPAARPAPIVQRSSVPPSGPSASRPLVPNSLTAQTSLQRTDNAPSSFDLPGTVPLGLGMPATPLAPPDPVSVRPLPPPVMVMRSASAAEAMPSVSRSIEAPEPLYSPDPIPEAPLLGLRPMEGGFAGAEPSAATDSPAPEPRASEPGSAVAQRSTWSYMPPPPPSADFSLPDSFTGSVGTASAASAPFVPPVAQRSASPATGPVALAPEPSEPLPVAAAAVSLQNMPAQSVSLQAMTEAPPPPVETVIQRVATPPPSITVQAVDAAPTPAAAPATAGAAPAADPAALLAVLYEPLVRRLRADLRVDRERRGRLTDL
jgi:hypothetical protein